MKKIISICLVLVTLFCLIPMNTAAAPVKDGYTLAPLLFSASGVDVSSPFLLTAPPGVKVEDISGALSIDGQLKPAVSQNGENEFVITPVVTLASNSLYIFRLEREGKPDITWAFQTAEKFQIVSSFPSNQATNVPKKSGIEITFSSEGFTPLKDYFSISPNVAGRFEYHKKTVVFVPASLDYKTVYTVTIKAGITLEGTGEQLLTDYTFSFETEAPPDYNPPATYDDIYFSNSYVELPTIEPPRLSYRVYHRGDELRPVPEINVYKFDNADQAVNAARKLAGVPSWSRYAREENLLEAGGLNLAATFSVDDVTWNSYYGYMEMPEKLSQGFYLVDASFGGARDQMIVQINDLPVQVIGDGEQTLVWVNDISTGGASPGATVYDRKEGKTYITDADGLAKIDRAISVDSSERLDVTSKNGKQCIWIYTPVYVIIPDYYYSGYALNNSAVNVSYWTAFQLDRTLFRPDDTVSFFGFVQDRAGVETIGDVTAVLTEGYNYGYNSSRDVLQKQTLPVENGIYSDEMELPNVNLGVYCITIYYGDIIIGSTYFSVYDYVKPPYKIEAAADKKAAFAGDTVTFTAKAGFFEGTPVSDLDVSYRIYSYSYNSLMTSGRGNAVTDIDGKVEISEVIVPMDSAQGQATLSFSVEATLPEIGRTTQYASVRAFINDIDVKVQASRVEKNADLTVDINSITLDRLNDGTAKHYNDYLDKPVARKTISVNIYRVYYVKAEYGSYYDYIEKKVVPRYRYNSNKELIDSFEITTDSNGRAEKSFTVPNRESESYYAEISCVDGNGRNISYTTYIGRDYSSYYSNVNTNEYYLDGVKTSYDIGEEVSMTLKRGTDVVTKGNFLYVVMQRGIQLYQAGKNPFSFEFSEKNVPNVGVNLFYFNGLKYQTGYYLNANIQYDYSRNNLELTAVTDKESYKPGDTCNIKITARDENGNAKKAAVNISIVDEALFALRDYNVYTLASLYRNLNNSLRLSSATHRTYIPSLDTGDDITLDNEVAMSAAPGSAAEGEDETYLRETFKDTALFATVNTDEKGEATYSFALPDNITSWRLTISGISNDLYAGNTVQNIIVTNPMFLTYSLNDEFLIGDIPTIGVNVYGTGLTGGESVSFEVWDENAPEVVYKGSGASFERVNIPLWEMKSEGANALIVKATVSNGTSDAVRHQFRVIKTYREIDAAEYYDVTADTVFNVGNDGLTNITFTDRGRGAFLYQLINLRYGYGDRVEKMLVRREANRLLSEYFPDIELYNGKDGFDVKRYQRGDGGIAILPYSDSDVTTTVKLLPYILDDVNVNMLKKYLYSVYEGENAENKMCALYGLAILKEPILIDLNNYALLDVLSVKDAVYIALGYCALGEFDLASGIYGERIAPLLVKAIPYYRVDTGADNDDILEATSAASALASMLDMPEKDGLYRYCIDNYTTDILINVEKLFSIEREISKRADTGGSITYSLFGDEYTRMLRYGGSYTLRIPVQNMDRFKLLDVTGEVGAVSVYKKPLEDIGDLDNDITVRRRYYKADGSVDSSYTFEQGDLVRVQIWIDYSAKAIDGSYCVTDYLPAGLEYVSGSAKINGASSFGYGYFRYCTVEGQRVTFYDYNGRFDKGYLYYYYARVISPGTFKAEGPLVQNLTAKDVYTIGEDNIVVITG